LKRNYIWGHDYKNVKYHWSIRFIISELILNGNKPNSLIRQGRRRRRERRKIW
jgi:hypothetical protein